MTPNFLLASAYCVASGFSGGPLVGVTVLPAVDGALGGVDGALGGDSGAFGAGLTVTPFSAAAWALSSSTNVRSCSGVSRSMLIRILPESVKATGGSPCLPSQFCQALR